MPTIHDHVRVGLERLGLTIGEGGSPGGSGETNYGVNVGAGEGQVYRDKTGVALNFRTLKQGPGIIIETNGDVIDISAEDPPTPVNTDESYDAFGASPAEVVINNAEGQGELTFSPTGTIRHVLNLDNASNEVGGFLVASDGTPGAVNLSRGYALFKRSGESEDPNDFDLYSDAYDWQVRPVSTHRVIPQGSGKAIVALQDKTPSNTVDAWGVFGEHDGNSGTDTKGYLRCRVLDVPETNKLSFVVRGYSADIEAETGDVTFKARGGIIALNSAADPTLDTAVDDNLVGAINELVADIVDLQNPDYIDFNPITDLAHVEGRVHYNSEAKALTYYNEESDVAVNLGQEEVIRVQNDSGGLIANGKIVYINGAAGGLPTIELADAKDFDKSRIIGMVTHDIEDASIGYVTQFGNVNDLNTSGKTVGSICYLDPDNPGDCTTTRPTGGAYPVIIGVVTIENATTGRIFVLPNISQYTAETVQTLGWVDILQYTLSFDAPTRTLTLSPVGTEFRWYQGGMRYSKATDSIAITVDGGLHLIYYDNGTLVDLVNPTQTQASTIIRTKPTVAYVYWDDTNSKEIYVGFESHTIGMPALTHNYLHFTRGAQYISGQAATNVIADDTGDLDTHAQFGITAGVNADEDVPMFPVDVASTVGLPIYHLEGSEASPVVRQVINPGFSVRTTGTGRLAYNQLSGGTWSVAEVDNLDFALCHVFGLNDADTSRRLIAFMGQSEYDSLAEARIGAETEITDVVTAGIVSPELVPLYSFIFQTSNGYANAVKSRIRTTEEGDDFIDWRFRSFGGGGGGGAVAPVFSDAEFQVFDDSDPTKIIKFQASGLTTGATRIYTFPDADVTLVGDTHATRHEDGGADEINVGGLSGELADDQPPKTHSLTTKHTAGNWKVVYTSGAGAVTELPLGDEGTFLQSNGVAAAPTWEPAGGASLGEVWQYVSGTTDSDPGSGKFKLNNASPPSATWIYVSDSADNGADFSNILQALGSNDRIYIQEQKDSTRYHVYKVTGDAVDGTTYVKIPVTAESSGSNIQTSRKCGFVFLFSSGGGSGSGNMTYHGEKTSYSAVLSISSPNVGDTALLNDDTFAPEKKLFTYTGRGSSSRENWQVEGETITRELGGSVTAHYAIRPFRSASTGNDGKVRTPTADNQGDAFGVCPEGGSSGDDRLIAISGLWYGIPSASMNQGRQVSVNSSGQIRLAIVGGPILGISQKYITTGGSRHPIILSPGMAYENWT